MAGSTRYHNDKDQMNNLCGSCWQCRWVSADPLTAIYRSKIIVLLYLGLWFQSKIQKKGINSIRYRHFQFWLGHWRGFYFYGNNISWLATAWGLSTECLDQVRESEPQNVQKVWVYTNFLMSRIKMKSSHASYYVQPLKLIWHERIQHTVKSMCKNKA